MQVKLNYLKTLTDSVGILQHGLHAIPNFKEGYSTDDNARALITVLKYHGLFDSGEALELAKTYLGFLHFVQREDGFFHNYVSFDRRFLDDVGAGDCQGRVLWACGYAIDSKIPENMKATAKQLFDDAAKNIPSLLDDRSIAFAIMGTWHYYRQFPQQKDLLEKIGDGAKLLVERFEENAAPEWQWFDNRLTYSNARIPQALLLAFDATKEEKFRETALAAIDFLRKETIVDGMFMPIGQNGWYERGGKKALYDQQPVEAAGMVDALAAAFEKTGNKQYFRDALACFEWFHGKNTLGEKLADENNGACFDGLTPTEVNRNHGAESTLSYLLSTMKVIELQRTSIVEEPAEK